MSVDTPYRPERRRLLHRRKIMVLLGSLCLGLIVLVFAGMELRSRPVTPKDTSNIATLAKAKKNDASHPRIGN